MAQTIELLYRETCPYSQKVLKYVREHQLDDQLKFSDVGADPKALERLKDLTGGGQVPCLVLGEEPMLESDDIIQYLADKYVN